MLNLPVGGGTSGHLMGAALAAVLLGPWLACLVMVVLLGAQAFLFADGGITALGHGRVPPARARARGACAPRHARAGLLGDDAPRRAGCATATPAGATRWTGSISSSPTGSGSRSWGPHGAGKTTLMLHLNGLLRGERRRAAIATVLAMRPELLVLDEPSASLDPRSRRELVEILSTLGFDLDRVVAYHRERRYA